MQKSDIRYPIKLFHPLIRCPPKWPLDATPLYAFTTRPFHYSAVRADGGHRGGTGAGRPAARRRRRNAAHFLLLLGQSGQRKGVGTGEREVGACGPLGWGLGTNPAQQREGSSRERPRGPEAPPGLPRGGRRQSPRAEAGAAAPGSSRATAGRALGLFRGDTGSRPAPQLTESESVLRCWKDSAPSTKPDSTADVLSPSMLGHSGEPLGGAGRSAPGPSL